MVARASGERKTSARRLSSAERKKRVLELAKAGLTPTRIAASATSKDDPTPLFPGPHGRKRVHDILTAHMAEVAKETRGRAAEYRAMELERLAELQSALWPAATQRRRLVRCDECHKPAKCECGKTTEREVDTTATDRIIKIIDRRSKFLGLDATHEHEERHLQLLEGQVDAAFDAMVEAMDRAGIPPDKQAEVLGHVGDVLREHDETDQA